MLPSPDGLYDPQFEHDACGVGFVVQKQGIPSHSIVDQGLTILKNLAHRGACGCDPETGDGAGILTQIPHPLFARELGDILPPAGEYGVGMVFFPTDESEREICKMVIQKVVRDEGLTFICWRNVLVNKRKIGQKSQEVRPYIMQFFVGPGPTMTDVLHDDGAFERKLYVVRKVIEKTAAHRPLQQQSYFYVCSLSSRTIVYKGLLMANQLGVFFRDLTDPDYVTALALVHQRFSTNTFPTWDLAHPYRILAHNGEINTLRGNRNWMRAREAKLTSEKFGSDVEKLKPLVSEQGSDSATLDNAVELLMMGGRSLPHAMMMLMPEAWSANEDMDPERRAFYEYHACIMEPWDGPAAIAFSDGRSVGAILDRNGLRPARYLETHDGLVVMASEAGVLDIPAENIKSKWRLQPGKIFLVDTVAGKIVSDDELKNKLAKRQPYSAWLSENRIELRGLLDAQDEPATDPYTLLDRQQVFGYTIEDLKVIIGPMAQIGEQPLGSMGNDSPLAVLSERSQLLYSYFKQMFAQVTNPPIDPIREELVMSLVHYIGANGSLLEETEDNARQVRLESPLLTNKELAKLRAISATQGEFTTCTIPIVFDPTTGAAGLEAALTSLQRAASQSIKNHNSVIILSDRMVGKGLAPIPALLAVSAVHHYLIRQGTRTNTAIVLESGEPREVHHFCLLVGYGASAINPYLAFETVSNLHKQGLLSEGLSHDAAQYNFIKAINKGVLKTMAKMGISTLQSYRGAQIFEAVGLNESLIRDYFTGTPSRISGIGLDVIAQEAINRHREAYPEYHVPDNLKMEPGGHYQWRRGGERHQLNPDTIAKLQHSVNATDQSRGWATFKEFSASVNERDSKLETLRSLLEFESSNPSVPLSEVEPAKEIVKRFATGAMSLGSISRRAHETIAIAMNRLGGRSNTGEGGEDSRRYTPDANGDRRRSAIKQVASGRFGVTAHYLVNADELQIKMAQGAKPGEGGELPGRKVDEYIASVRHTTPGVGLVSPPPHHDIYSIEDLAQLIFDLKNVNPKARVSVKLVAEAGVGTVAAGVVKALADVVLISGYEGGTGASPLSSIKHTGIPWELGLAETQQVLVKNDLRGRVRLQTDGQLKTGRDVVIAALLGAEEFGFSSAPLVAMGCIMMRVCHLGTCPVGIATQDPVLAERFEGTPEQVIQYFFFVAEEVREIMASLGVRRFDDLVGHVEMLKMRKNISHWKARGLNLSILLKKPEVPEGIAIRYVRPQDDSLKEAIDYGLIAECREALSTGAGISIPGTIRNSNRTVGSMLSGEVVIERGEKGFPQDTIQINLRGSAGQSFGAFLARGITLRLEGEANDYLGKGLSGGRIIVYPPNGATFAAHENIIAGNTLLYGATSGQVFLSGVVGERFGVRNSGAIAVVEGTGDHCCEYMTGGVVVVLGETGRNFAAGMSGGVAFVWDPDRRLAQRVNRNHGSLQLEEVIDPNDIDALHCLIDEHLSLTDSVRAKYILNHWDECLPQFTKLISSEYKQLIAKTAPRELVNTMAA